jgi:membrane protein YqaA with SNARE-associated domain
MKSGTDVFVPVYSGAYKPMLLHRTIELLKPTREVFHWLHHLGGPGLIVLGLIDNSVIPVPGSMDALTIILSANQRKLWPYYALMATIGSVVGGYITYRIAFRQGKSAMERRFSRKRINKVTKTFEKWGFGAVLIPAMLPPPAPMVPFLIAAGAMQYSRNKFLAALAIGRAIRFTILACLSAFYGRLILTIITNHARPILITFIVVSVSLGLYILFHYRKKLHFKKNKARQAA